MNEVDVKEEMAHLTEEERMEIVVAVHFAELARKRPDSEWSRLGEDTPEAQMIGSAEMVRECEATILRLIQTGDRRATLRAALN